MVAGGAYLGTGEQTFPYSMADSNARNPHRFGAAPHEVCDTSQQHCSDSASKVEVFTSEQPDMRQD